MVEFLKKIGFPATVAAIVGALVTIIPIFFKLDERYAKEENLTKETARIEKQINELSIEVGKLAGSTQVLVSVIASKSETPKVEYVPQPKLSLMKVEPKPVAVMSHPVSVSADAPMPEDVFKTSEVAPDPVPPKTVTIAVGKPIPVKQSAVAQLKDISATLYGINQRVEQLQSKK